MCMCMCVFHIVPSCTVVKEGYKQQIAATLRKHMRKHDGNADNKNNDREIVDHRRPDEAVAHKDPDHVREGWREKSCNGAQGAAG